MRVWFSYFVYGFYPLGRALAGRLFFVALAFGIVWLLWLSAPRRDLGALYFFVVLPILSFVLLHGAPLIGLAVVPTSLWGGILVTVVVATIGIVVSLPLGIVLALGRRSELPVVRLFSVDLHRIRPRRAADHRAVHGERDAAAVRSRALCARQAGARADRRRAVRVGLHGGGGARRARRGPARPIRGGAGARARAIGA